MFFNRAERSNVPLTSVYTAVFIGLAMTQIDQSASQFFLHTELK